MHVFTIYVAGRRDMRESRANGENGPKLFGGALVDGMAMCYYSEGAPSVDKNTRQVGDLEV